ncbi:hypothetical protein FDP41_006835 [Naegleria fowleri]|uniref:DSBA-like thioredoxin domain-containing protein n=1 Tax=Naegleria fowleri TaxID=5763 RepID=A0A6A5BKT1_NAEFO|nr:uncharacterized protein FDP41_006835 [Naegleria fowleri]KAF0974225.1 hypothetical protein FDP41_006835 [Naegleria fowleri]CAG4711600.1 unnamed protein product [Naegleria fowleri]
MSPPNDDASAPSSCSGDACDYSHCVPNTQHSHHVQQETSCSTMNHHSTQQHIHIEIISDVGCPFCFLGKTQLEKALELLGAKYINTSSPITNITYSIEWKPFLLNPSIPAEGQERARFFKVKFGVEFSEEEKKNPSLLLKAMPMLAHIEQMGQDLGITTMNVANMNLPMINSLNAHRLMKLVAERYPPREYDTQNQVSERIFRSYFEQALDVSKVEVLKQIVKDCHIEKDVTENFFLEDPLTNSGDLYLTQVKDEARRASFSTNGVPYFNFVNVTRGVRTNGSGAMGVQKFLKILQSLVK